MAIMSRAGSPMLNDDGTVLGEVSGLTVGRSDDGWYVEVNGVVRGVECFG